MPFAVYYCMLDVTMSFNDNVYDIFVTEETI